MLKRASVFYTVFILTIFFIRIEVFLFPLRRILIGDVRINHFWIGIVLVLVSMFFLDKYGALRKIFFPVGLGLAVDELTFMLINGTTVDDYWSMYSISGVIILTVIVFIFKNKLIKKLYENSN